MRFSPCISRSTYVRAYRDRPQVSLSLQTRPLDVPIALSQNCTQDRQLSWRIVKPAAYSVDFHLGKLAPDGFMQLARIFRMNRVVRLGVVSSCERSGGTYQVIDVLLESASDAPCSGLLTRSNPPRLPVGSIPSTHLLYSGLRPPSALGGFSSDFPSFGLNSSVLSSACSEEDLGSGEPYVARGSFEMSMVARTTV